MDIQKVFQDQSNIVLLDPDPYESPMRIRSTATKHSQFPQLGTDPELLHLVGIRSGSVTGSDHFINWQNRCRFNRKIF